jgi:hypothetical protein
MDEARWMEELTREWEQECSRALPPGARVSTGSSPPMRGLITIRRPSRDFTIPSWAFLFVGREGARHSALRLARAVRERVTRRRRQ